MPPTRSTSRPDCLYSNCSKNFVNEKAMRKHMEESHKPPKFCPIEGCIPKYSTRRRSRLLKHFTHVHGINQDDARALGRGVENITPYDADVHHELIAAPELNQHFSTPIRVENQEDALLNAFHPNLYTLSEVPTAQEDYWQDEAEPEFEEQQYEEASPHCLHGPVTQHNSTGISFGAQAVQSVRAALVPVISSGLRSPLALWSSLSNGASTPSEQPSTQPEPKAISNYPLSARLSKEIEQSKIGVESKNQSASFSIATPDNHSELGSFFDDQAPSEPMQNHSQDRHETGQVARPSPAETDVNLHTMSRVKLDKTQGEQELLAAQSDIPFTDSGYHSAPILNHGPHSESVSPYSTPNNPTVGGNRDQNTKTCYSVGSTVDPRYAQNLIIQLSNDIHHKVRHTIITEDRSLLSTVLPELMKAFAIKICHDTPTKANRDIMCFLYKRNKTIAAQIEETFYPEEECESRSGRDRTEDMSFIDKMSLWNSKADQDFSITPKKHELFEGVKDDENEFIDQDNVRAYNKLIIDSAAYEWFLVSLKSESIQQLETSQLRVRQTILNNLPTGVISKRRPPNVHEVTFDLRSQQRLTEDFQCEICEILKFHDFSTHNSFLTTESGKHVQGITIKQYLAQTWPTNGLQLLDALQKAVISAGKYFEINLPGNTRMEVKISSSHLIVTATGPAYFVAECGETLAWIGSALLSSFTNYKGYCTSSIENFQIDSPIDLAVPKYKGNCHINLEVIQPKTTHDSLSTTETLVEGLIGKRIHILGFPIHRRPEGYPGLELSFNTILQSLQAKQVDTTGGHTFVNGLKRTIKLVKHAGSIYLWHLFRSSSDPCLCSVDQHDKVDVGKTHSPSGHHGIETGRHIVMNCTGVSAVSEDIQCSFEKLSFVNNNADQPSPTVNNTKLFQPASQPSSPATSSEDSLDSAMLSVSDGSEHIEPQEYNEDIYKVISNAIDQFVSEFRSATQNQMSPAESRENSGALTTAAQSPRIENTSGSSRKRSPDRQSDENNGDDGTIPPPPKKRQPNGLQTSKRSFACPYMKRNPFEHRKCRERKLTRIRDVKQHLTRKHAPDRYCQKCQVTSFPDDRSLQMHIDGGKCTSRNPIMLDGMSYQQQRQLSRKSSPKTNEEDQWFAVWDMLFPGQKRPNSVYVDTEPNPEMLQFREYCQNRLPEVVREEIESDLSWLRPETTEQECRIYLGRAISRVINSLVAGWPSDYPPASVSLGNYSSNSQPPRLETPTSSNADSGVAVESQISSLETRVQERGSSQTYKILERKPTSQPEVVGYHEISPSVEQESVLPLLQTNPQSVPPILFDSVTEGQNVNGESLSQWVDIPFPYPLDHGLSDANIVQMLDETLDYFP